MNVCFGVIAFVSVALHLVVKWMYLYFFLFLCVTFRLTTSVRVALYVRFWEGYRFRFTFFFLGQLSSTYRLRSSLWLPTGLSIKHRMSQL